MPDSDSKKSTDICKDLGNSLGRNFRSLGGEAGVQTGAKEDSLPTSSAKATLPHPPPPSFPAQSRLERHTVRERQSWVAREAQYLRLSAGKGRTTSHCQLSFLSMSTEGWLRNPMRTETRKKYRCSKPGKRIWGD